MKFIKKCLLLSLTFISINSFTMDKIKKYVTNMFATAEERKANATKELKNILTELVNLPQNNVHQNVINDFFAQMKELINAGANVNVGHSDKGMVSYTPLFLAIQFNRPEMVQFLLNNHANPNDQIFYTRHTALMEAVEHGHSDIVQMLLAAGATLNNTNNFGNTALIIATVQNHVPIVKLLLEHHANPNIINNDGNTALDVARKEKKQEIIDLLKPEFQKIL